MITTTIMIGLPASGKSTYAAFISMGREAIIVLSSDKIRQELYGDESVQGNPAEVFGTLYGRMETALKNAESVVIDATNMTKRDREKAIYLGKKYGDLVKGIVMDTPIAECIRRNDARERKVPDFVFDRMIAKYEEPTLSEGFDYIVREQPIQ